MKKFSKILVALAAVLVAVAPFLTQTANACAVGLYEEEMPDCLK